MLSGSKFRKCTNPQSLLNKANSDQTRETEVWHSQLDKSANV